MQGSFMRGTIALALLVSITGVTASAASPFDDLLTRVPPDANVIMVADIPAIQNSPFGAARKLAEKRLRDYRSGLTDIPPTARRAVIAEVFDYATLRPVWRMGIIEVSTPLTPDQVAKRQTGTLDTVGGLPVVVCPKGELFVFFSPTIIGEVTGIQRQELARWLRAGNSRKQPAISDYLRQAAESVGTDAQLVEAFDLDEVFHSAGLQEKLKDSKAVSESGVDASKVVDTLAGLRGAQLRMKMTDAIVGEIRLDFPRPPEVLRSVGKPLLLEIIGRMGAEIEDVNNWTPRIEGNQFVLRGAITLVNARLMLSPVDFRSTRQAYMEQVDSGTTSELHADPKVRASVDYYRTLTALLEDIEPGKKANNTERRTYYYKLYADKIDALPILNVDPDVLQVGAAISVTLRNMSYMSSMSVQQYSNIMAQYQQGFADAAVGYGGYGPYGYGGYVYSVPTPSAVNIDNFQQIRGMLATNATNMKAYREQTWVNIKVVLQNLRRKLVEKYQVDI
jgi:hypothetical protein